jgi:acyl carrier protein
MKHNEFKQLLTELWQKELGIAQVEEDETFFDLGGTSRSAVSIADQVEARTEFELTLADLAHQSFQELVEQYAPKEA